jgi:hypothetical protein
MSETNKNPNQEKKAANNNELASLVEKLSILISENKNNTDLLHSRAELLIKLQQYGKAINDYRTILAIDLKDKYAAGQIEMLSTILRFTGNDIYANPNTNLDPWLE